MTGLFWTTNKNYFNLIGSDNEDIYFYTTSTDKNDLKLLRPYLKPDKNIFTKVAPEELLEWD